MNVQLLQKYRVDQKLLFHKPEDGSCCIGEGHGCNLHIHPSLCKYKHRGILAFKLLLFFLVSYVHVGDVVILNLSILFHFMLLTLCHQFHEWEFLH